MDKNCFQFRKFLINQDRCAMKVGTDGTLLGAWADAPSGKCRILDIGTGTGLIALMMAQRFPESEVLGVDIDSDATIQAQENVAASPFCRRIKILQMDAIKIDDEEKFDAIVCNPPYFNNSLTCAKEQRSLARHTVGLTYDALMSTAYRLLSNDGCLSIIIPSESNDSVESAAAFSGFIISRICLIKTTPNKQPKRQLMEFKKYNPGTIDFREEILEIVPNIRSKWYYELTQDFYIK